MCDIDYDCIELFRQNQYPGKKRESVQRYG